MRRLDPLRVSKVAELLGVPSYQVRRAIRGGYLKAFTVMPGDFSHYLVEPNDLLDYAKRYLTDKMYKSIKKELGK